MVVLEESGMLTTGHNQYLQPDYLSPLPTTLDAKKSPLALLAQTCSQIGADSPTKPLISPLEKSSKGITSASDAKSPPAAKLERSTRSSPSDGKSLAFKPYETNVVPKKSTDDGRPGSKASVHSVSGQDSVVSASDCGRTENEKKSSGNRTPVGRKSTSPANHHPPATATSAPSLDRKTPVDRDKSDASPERTGSTNNNNNNNNNSGGASPIIRSGIEILSGGHAKDSSLGSYKSSLSGFANSQLCCPPALAENPAFRPPFAGAPPFGHPHAAAAAAATALLGYPSAAPTAGNPYLSYARVKTPTGGEALVPMCKDPYCTGCQYSMHSAQMMMGAASSCPSGCTQCDHQKYGLAMALSLGSMAQSSLSYPSTLTGGRPYVCNWIVGETYCGKRFTTSEELLQHLRSHTSLAGSEHGSSSAHLGSPHPHPLLSPSASLHRAASTGSYPTPSLSPLSARYHPYGKPPTGPLPGSLAASPYSAFNALGPYYSPYAIYSQRIGAVVHP